MILRACTALIASLIATLILLDSGEADSYVHAAGVLTMRNYPSAAASERDTMQIGTAGFPYRSDCFAPRPVAVQLVASNLSTGHRLVGGSRARQITCARG